MDLSLAGSRPFCFDEASISFHIGKEGAWKSGDRRSHELNSGHIRA
jgi:hypothetical protein